MILVFATTLRFALIRFLQCRFQRALFLLSNKRLSSMCARAACSRRMAFAASLKMKADTRGIMAAVLASATALIIKEPIGDGWWGLLCSLICEFTASARRRGVSLNR